MSILNINVQEIGSNIFGGEKDEGRGEVIYDQTVSDLINSARL